MTLFMSAAEAAATGRVSAHARAHAIEKRRRGLMVGSGCGVATGDASRPRVDVHVNPGGVQDRMVFVPLHPRMNQLVAQAGYANLPGAVDLHLARHLEVQVPALRGIG